MFEIKITRTWDGRYLAVMPGVHPNCSCIGNTLQGTVRAAQASALNLLADLIRGNQEMPAAMREWFFTVSPQGVTPVGGIRHRELPDAVLYHPDNNVIPPRPPDESKPTLPKHGTPAYDKLMASMVPGLKPTAPAEPAPAEPAPAETEVVPDADHHEQRQ